MAMGVDDPQRVFKSDEFVIRERDEAKFMELGGIPPQLERVPYESLVCELASKYLPIILSVRVEATETFMKPRNPKFNLHVRWEGLISTLHFEPPYGRFVQTHPYAPIYYSWLLKNDGEGPTWEDLYAEIGPFSPEGVPLGDHNLTASVVGCLIGNLALTIGAVSCTPSPESFVFPPSSSNEITIVGESSSSSSRAGTPPPRARDRTDIRPHAEFGSRGFGCVTPKEGGGRNGGLDLPGGLVGLRRHRGRVAH